VTASNAVEALAAKGSFDAALVDYHLGDGPDGLAVVTALRDLGQGRVALITADDSDELVTRAQAAGITLMSKPVRPASLKAFLTSPGDQD
jgi:CheY-like chemotaxis protein